MTYASIGDLRMSAVAAFVRTAVLIDNEPRADAATPAPTAAHKPQVAVSGAFGAAAPRAEGLPDGEVPAAEAYDAAAPEQAGEAPIEEFDGKEATEPMGVPANGHQLPVRPVTNAFAARKITCGFYFPKDDDADLVEIALAAARHVDATIVDWQLRAGDAGPAQSLIARLVQEDRDAGGRLRLIVVYTGERGLDAECKRLRDYMAAAGLADFEPEDDGRALRAEHTLITFANKPAQVGADLEFPGPGSRPIAWEALPEFVLDKYSSLTAGLLQAFALKSIGAVRDDTHHLISMFPPELDAAFLAQRGGIGSPADAEEMMTALLLSEFAISIADHGVPADILGGTSAALAVVAREEPQKIPVETYKTEDVYKDIVVHPQGGKRHILADEASLKALVQSGLDGAIIDLREAHRKQLDLQYFKDDEQGRRVLSRFARLATFSREAHPSRRIGSAPLILTHGVLIRAVTPAAGDAPETVRYLLCVQPGCDAVRLEGTVAFPFCPLIEKSEVFDLAVNVGGGDKRLRVERRPRDLTHVEFTATPETQTVQSVVVDEKVGFRAADGRFWEFVAELRPLEAQHVTTLVVGKFNRVALNSSEWLRLHRPKDNA